MKRLLAILLVLIGITFLTACGSTTDTTDTADDTKDDSLATELIGKWESENEVGPIKTDDGQEITGTVTYTYTFDEDGTVELVTKQELDEDGTMADTYEYTTTGTYTLENDELSITMDKEDATNENAGDTEEESGTNTLAMKTLTEESQLNKPGVATIHKIEIKDDEMTMTNGVGDFTFKHIDS